MTRDDAVAWLLARAWTVTEIRVNALVEDIDLERVPCKAWSDDGPCRTCILDAVERKTEGRPR